MAHEYVYWNRDHTHKSYSDHGHAPQPADWYKGAGNGHVADHAYRPVMVDAQGRKRPVMLFCPGGDKKEAYVTTETVVERFVPAATEYKYSYPEYNKHSSPERAVAPNEHKYRYPVRVEYKLCPTPGMVDEGKYGYPVREEEYKDSSPERANPVRVEYKICPPAGKVDEPKYEVPVRLEYYQRSSPVRMEYKPVVDEQPYSHPVRVLEEYRHSSPAKEPAHDNTPPPPPSPEVKQFMTKTQTEVSLPPATRPGPLTALNWRQPRNWSNGNLTTPTRDIGAAVDFLKEAAMPSSVQHVRFSAPPSTGPRYTGTIDSKTAVEKYKGASLTDDKLKGGKVP